MQEQQQQQQLKPFASPSFGRVPQNPTARVVASSSSLLYSSDFSPATTTTMHHPPYYSAVTARVDALIAELDRLVERG